jgi:hypothetical protein
MYHIKDSDGLVQSHECELCEHLERPPRPAPSKIDHMNAIMSEII